METIELEKGWLSRQMREVCQDAQDWPEVLKPLASINASLVHQPTDPISRPVHDKSEDKQVESQMAK